MEKVDYVFVVLVYRNVDDLEACIDSILNKIYNFRIVVVNSYYDEESKNIIEGIAKKRGCDFLNIENKGYGFGNNEGIVFAEQKYDYKHIIVSNPDIVIEKFCDIAQINADIIAPNITTRNRKNQNPMYVLDLPIISRLIYCGLKNNNMIVFYMGIILNKMVRAISIMNMRIFNKQVMKIYMAHGSFVIFSREAIKKLGYRIYDENIFLFAEEAILAYKAKQCNLKTVFYSNVVINHMEDGSMKLSNISINEEIRKSNLYYFENYKYGGV